MAGGKLTGGIIEFAGANTPGWVNNLGMGYAAGVTTIYDAQGTTLSTSNPGWITMPSVTHGQMVALQVQANFTFNDDAHASSDFTNIGYGITETANWAEDVPFFLYAVNKADAHFTGADGASTLAVARHPWHRFTPIANRLTTTAGAALTTDDENTMMLLGDYTLANYNALPCVCIGAFRMQWSTATDDWTVQTLGASDGIGFQQVIRTCMMTWNFPTGQMGAASGTHWMDNGGTAPVWAAGSVAQYKYHLNGQIEYWGNNGGDGGTDGAGAVSCKLATPFTPNFISASRNHMLGTGFLAGVTIGNDEELVGPRMEHATPAVYFFSGQNGDDPILNSDFANGGRSAEWHVQFNGAPTS